MEELIGKGATMCCLCDRYPYTIIGVEYNIKSGSLLHLVVQEDEAQLKTEIGHFICGTVAGEDEKYIYRRNLNGKVFILRWNKRHEQWQTKNGVRFAIGTRSFYQALEV